MIVIFDAAAALAEQGIHLRAATVGSHKTTCPACSHQRRKKNEPCLSVTVNEDGKAVFNCHHCGWNGAAGGGDFRSAKARRSYRKPERVENPARPDKLIEWFGKRGISRAIVEAAGIYRTQIWFPQTNSEMDAIAFPYEWAGELRNVKYRSASKDFRQEKDPEPVLYNADSIIPGSDLIICEGEVDVLSFVEAGFMSVVSLPNGAPAKEESSERRYEPLATHAEALEAVSRILIATDMDGPGELLAAELARRLGKDRCLRVRFPSRDDIQEKDANETLVNHGAEVLKECVANASPWPIDGLHDVSDFRDEVMDLYFGRGPQPLSTGFVEMDRAFRYMPGQFIVVTGIPNHGKSRWVDQVAVQTARIHKDRWAIFSPETGEANHIADLCEVWAGFPFHDGPTPRMTVKELENAVAWVRDRFVFINSKDHTPSIDWILERAKAAVIRSGINHLIIDPYNEVEASRPTKLTETEFISQFISKCKRFAAHHDVTVWIIVHPTKLRPAPGETQEPVPSLYDLAGSAHWRNKADAGLVVYRDYQKEETVVISKKIRFQPRCGEPGQVRFQFLGAERRFAEMPQTYSRLGTREAA